MELPGALGNRWMFGKGDLVAARGWISKIDTDGIK
jgi:hypothetical protein